MSNCPLLHEDSCLKSEYDCTCDTCPLHEIKKEKKKKKGKAMLTEKDKIEQFKRDCKSNEYYTKAVMDCNDRIEELDLKLTGITSAASDSPKCENGRNPYKDNKLGLLMLQDQIINERDEYIRKINSVSTKLMKITDPIDRQMVTDLYIHKKHHETIADRYHYANRASLYKHVNNVIGKIV